MLTRTIVNKVGQQQNSPVGIYLFKFNNENTRIICEICSQLTIKTPDRRHWRRSDVFIVKFENISQLDLVFPWLTLNKQMPAGQEHKFSAD